MIVFVGGMPRSGSTFAFNVVRDVLLRRGTLYQAASADLVPLLESAGAVDHLIFKAHAADETTVRLLRLGAVKAVCTLRKPEDAVASWVEAFGGSLDDAIAVLASWFDLYDRIATFALILHYDLIDRGPAEAALRIAQHVCSDVSRPEVLEIAQRHAKEAVFRFSRALARTDPHVRDVGFSHYDTRTFFHRHHVSSIETRAACERLGEDAVRSIRAALKDRVDENGDLRGCLSSPG